MATRRSLAPRAAAKSDQRPGSARPDTARSLSAVSGTKRPRPQTSRSLPEAPGTSPARRAGSRPGTAPREPLWRDVLGAELRRQRHERGATLGEIARRAGICPQYLSEIERGVKDPSSEMIAAVAGALDTTLVDLTLDVAQTLQQARPTPSGPVCQASFALAA